jgi:hypothetical protein
VGQLDGLTITPSAEAIEELGREWSWLVPERYQPVLFTALGDMFYETPSGEIWWLNTGTAELSKVADGRGEFQRLLCTEAADHWFLPPLIEELIQAGRVLNEGQCYTFVTLPVFREGAYAAENLNPVDAKQHFGLTGSIHKQISSLQDGDTVRLKILD